MKHVYIVFFIFISLVVSLLNFDMANAALTVSFGGRIYLAPIPGVTCIGVGTSTISSANVQGAIEAGNGKGAINKIGGLYKMIPVYATDPTKVPRFWKQILGRKKLIPDLKTCSIPALAGIPIPVLKTTNNYNVSR